MGHDSGTGRESSAVDPSSSANKDYEQLQVDWSFISAPVNASTAAGVSTPLATATNSAAAAAAPAFDSGGNSVAPLVSPISASVGVSKAAAISGPGVTAAPPPQYSINRIKLKVALMKIHQSDKASMSSAVASLSAADLAALATFEAQMNSLEPEVQLSALQQVVAVIDDSSDGNVAAIRVAVMCCLGQKLVDLLFSNNSATRQGAAAVLPVCLSSDNLSNTAFNAQSALPRAVEGLLLLLSSSSVSEQATAATVLRKIAYCQDRRATIAAVPQVVDRLVALLSSSSADVQQAAAAAVGNLAGLKANCAAIAAVPNALNKLVGLLASSNEDVQEEAAAAVNNIASEDSSEGMAAAILAAPQAIHNLAAALSSKSERSQKQAKAVLLEFAKHSTSRQIFAAPPVLSSLVALMGSSSEYYAISRALAAIAGLAAESPGNQAAIAAMPKMLDSLLMLLSSKSKPVVLQAVTALGNIAKDDVTKQAAILALPEVVDQLMALQVMPSGYGNYLWLNAAQQEEQRQVAQICRAADKAIRDLSN